MEAFARSSVEKKVELQTLLLAVPCAAKCGDKLQRIFWQNTYKIRLLCSHMTRILRAFSWYLTIFGISERIGGKLQRFGTKKNFKKFDRCERICQGFELETFYSQCFYTSPDYMLPYNSEHEQAGAGQMDKTLAQGYGGTFLKRYCSNFTFCANFLRVTITPVCRISMLTV